MKLAGQTIFITGASYGIGKSIAIKLAKEGGNVVITARTVEPSLDRPSTIYTVLKEVEDGGGKGLACAMDICDENQIHAAVKLTVETFGGIDILINNASFADLNTIEEIDIENYDLMNKTNIRGPYLVTKMCLPYLKKSKCGQILNIAPPINLKPFWFSTYLGFTICKYASSMCVLGLSESLRTFNISVNGLWPATAIDTVVSVRIMGKEQSYNYARNSKIMADAAYIILVDKSKPNGQFFIDEKVLLEAGISDLDQYLNNPAFKDKLLTDLYMDEVYTVDALTSLK